MEHSSSSKGSLTASQGALHLSRDSWVEQNEALELGHQRLHVLPTARSHWGHFLGEINSPATVGRPFLKFSCFRGHLTVRCVWVLPQEKCLICFLPKTIGIYKAPSSEALSRGAPSPETASRGATAILPRSSFKCSVIPWRHWQGHIG